MSSPAPISADILRTFPAPDAQRLEKDYQQALASFNKKIVVMDDDPTGVQTVHDISVYTDWEEESVQKGFEEESRMFFILTNSRGMTREMTVREHEKMARNIVQASRKTGKDFIMISRSDSTMRGHYPTEPLTLKTTVEALTGKRYDGEIIFPFFKEGGRFTIGNVHYVQEGDQLTPAGMTEFAHDATFGYLSSHLGEWCEEKTGGAYKAEQMIYIRLEDLRALDYDAIEAQLTGVRDFNKIIVNAVDYCDVKVFAIALIRALNAGKEFIIRSAAAITKVLGGVTDKPLLTHAELVNSDNRNGGVLIVGSHVNKTTQQLEVLKNSGLPIRYYEFDVTQALVEGGLEKEAARISACVEEDIEAGRSAAVFTSRKRLDPEGMDKEKKLMMSVGISNALTSIVGRLKVKPSFIVAKGGITSSDVGTKALRVQKAMVLGQIKPGIPVWLTDENSKFPFMPYVIFPGNVGGVSTLCEAMETLIRPDEA